MAKKTKKIESHGASALEAAWHPGGIEQLKVRASPEDEARPKKKTLSDSRRPTLPRPAKDPTTADGITLVFEFCNAIEQGRTPRRALLEELANRLRETLGPQGISADGALRLPKRGRGRPPKSENQQAIVAAVAQRAEAARKAKSESPIGEAQEAVAEELGLAVGTVRDIWEEWAPEDRDHLGALLEAAEMGLRKTRKA